jgi:uncharacterized protein YbjT (DUF2867 family)
MEGTDELIEAGGPDTLTQRDVAEMAFEVVGKPVKVTVVPLWLAGGRVKAIRLLCKQLGDLAYLIVTAREVDGTGPARRDTTLRSDFEELDRSAD